MASIRQAQCGSYAGGASFIAGTPVAVFTSPRMPVPLNCERVYVLFQLALLGDADWVGYIPKVYRGVDTSGVLVSQDAEIGVTGPGTNSENCFIAVVDNPGQSDFVQYTLGIEGDGDEDGGTAGPGAVLVLAF